MQMFYLIPWVLVFVVLTVPPQPSQARIGAGPCNPEVQTCI
ncbi:hypothetical protein [Paracoccus sp. (in: a-proteobacteria)]